MTFAYLLILAVLTVLTVRAAQHRRIPLLILSVLLILSCVMLLYFSVYYRAGEDAYRALPDRDAIPVGIGASTLFFDGPGEDSALIFYPGAKVEAAAYAPLLSKIAAGGTDCYLVEMPLHFAFLGVNAADHIIEAHDYAHWVLAGHSLGGVAASGYARTHTDTVAGLVLLASYPTAELDDMPFLSIYGDRDGVLNRESYEKSRALWPGDAEELVISGGNHAQFGDYGPQRGDGEAAIAQDEQQTQSAQAILHWIQTQISKEMKAA